MLARVFNLISNLAGFLLLTGGICSGALFLPLAASELETAPQKPGNSFRELDRFFVQNYGVLADESEKKSRPLLLVNGFKFTLLCEDGSARTCSGQGRLFNELKCVSHLAASLFAIGSRHWSEPESGKWREEMLAMRNFLQAAHLEVDAVDWSSAAWPGSENKVREFIRASLQKAMNFVEERLKQDDFSKESFSNFAGTYMPTMLCTFYLDSLGAIYDTLQELKVWKKELGEEKWNRMRVVIGGTQGRSTAGLTKENNPSALLIETLFLPRTDLNQIIIAPEAKSDSEALRTAGMVINAEMLADAIYGKAMSGKTEAFLYRALKDPVLPLALENVKSILRDLKDGSAKDPVLGIGPGKGID